MMKKEVQIMKEATTSRFDTSTSVTEDSERCIFCRAKTLKCYSKRPAFLGLEIKLEKAMKPTISFQISSAFECGRRIESTQNAPIMFSLNGNFDDVV